MARQTLMAVLMVMCAIAPACSSSSDGEIAAPTPATQPTIDTPTPTELPAPAPEPSKPAPTATPPAPTATPPVPAPTATPPAPTPDVEPDASAEVHVLNTFWLRDGLLVAGGRVVQTDSPARTAVDLLLRGPDFTATEAGFETAIGNGVTVLDLRISEGRAIVDLSPEFEAVSLGTSGELAMVAQLVFTATQFPTVDSVDIWIDGEEREYILSHGLEARGLIRDDFYDAAAPGIVVEQPIQGQFVWAPFRVTGFSRTFESNVQWQLTRGETIIASGFTTASQPDVGRHGPFEFVVELDDFNPAMGRGVVLSVYEESAKDGSRINVYEVPVFLMGSGPPAPASEALPWLRADGFGPIDFGMNVEAALAEIEATFGPPLRPASTINCEGGTISQLLWDGFRLNLSTAGTVEGWKYDLSDPPMTTPNGISPGTTRDDLVTAHPDVRFYRDTLSTEFSFESPGGTISGFVTDDGQHVTTLHAGWTCFFR